MFVELLNTLRPWQEGFNQTWGVFKSGKTHDRLIQPGGDQKGYNTPHRSDSQPHTLSPCTVFIQPVAPEYSEKIVVSARPSLARPLAQVVRYKTAVYTIDTYMKLVWECAHHEQHREIFRECSGPCGATLCTITIAPSWRRSSVKRPLCHNFINAACRPAAGGRIEQTRTKSVSLFCTYPPEYLG